MPDNGRRLTAVATTASAPVPPRVRTLIVDDSETVRDGLSLLLETQPLCELVGAVADPQAALELTRTAHPHVVLQDFSMPGVDTLELMRALVACRPQPAVLVLSAFADGPSASQAMAAGAVGWVLKDAEPKELIAAMLGAAGFRAAPGQHAGDIRIAPAGPAIAPVGDAPSEPAADARPGLEVATPLDARTLRALLRALDGDPAGLTVEALARRAVVTVPVAARYVQRAAARHPPLAAIASTGAEGSRYVLTAAGHHELARLEGRAAAAGDNAPALCASPRALG